MLEEYFVAARRVDLQREEIVSNALTLSRKITTFAMLEELSDLQAAFSYTPEELRQVSDEKLLLISQMIVNKIAEFIDDMGEYGIDHCTLSSFVKLLETYQQEKDALILDTAQGQG